MAATDYALRAVVLPFVAALRPLAPGIRVAVHTVQEAQVLDRMEHGALDLALLTPETAPPELHCQRLFDEHYVCVLRQGHPAAQSADASQMAPLTLDQFCALDHAMVSLQGGGFAGATDAALARVGRARRVVASVPSFVMLLDLVRTSDLVALVPARLLVGQTGLCAGPPPLEVQGFTKLLTWHARTHTDPAHRWMRGLLMHCSNAVH